MHLKGSQRAGANALAAHLTNANDNDHVTVHEIRGFMSDDIHGAFREMEAVSKGTKCVQYMFSLSLNPPIGANVTAEQYTDTADRIEEKLGLSGQPRVIVFHEKENRIHAHAVWSRIDPHEMKAINLPFFKNRLNELARDLYLENGWELPQGYLDKQKRDPLNYSLEEYSQAKRLDEHPKVIKALLQRCWNNSDNQNAFAASMKEYGFFLARGDRRGFVAVSMTGEILSLSRWLGVKSKDLRTKLGDKDALRSVTQVIKDVDENFRDRFTRFQAKLDEAKKEHLDPLLLERKAINAKQRVERADLKKRQTLRTEQENRLRQERFRKGISGLWDRMTGEQKKIRDQNENEMKRCADRDKKERHMLIQTQLKKRHHIVSKIQSVRADLQKQQRSISKVVTPSNMHTIERTVVKTQTLDLGR